MSNKTVTSTTPSTAISSHIEITSPDIINNQDDNITVSIISIKDGQPIPEISTSISTTQQDLYPKIIVLLMIKNEGKIIERCIRSSLSVADAICICDTGSTDNTLEVIERLAIQLSLEGLKIPIKVYHSTWENFGHNRTLSFKSARDMASMLDFDWENTYALLLDADMMLCNVNLEFNKKTLTEPGYKLIQKAGTLEYYNVRLIRLSANWICKCPTHEVWTGSESEIIKPSILFINDLNDGGCKSDKFQRDKRLLTEELERNPACARSMFYLGQTYDCLGEKDKAIQCYKKRLEMGGFYEEIFYSMYKICKLYLQKNEPIEAEYWAQKTFQKYPNRAETLLEMARYYRNNGDHYKAYHYVKLGKSLPVPNVLLFLDKSIYEYQLKYEETILNYYIGKRTDGLLSSVLYLKQYSYDQRNVHWNMQYYLRNFKETFSRLECKTGSLFSGSNGKEGDFHASSTALIPYRGEILANVRFVNFEPINGKYYMTHDGITSPSNIVKTKNKMALLRPDMSIRHMSDMIVFNIKTYPHNINGMEDVRLFCFDDETIHYLASSKDVSPEGKIVIVKGRYDIDTGRLTDNIIIKSPVGANCEKNWIMLENDICIYNWNPFIVARIKEDRLDYLQETPTDGFLKNMRGSTNFIKTSPNKYVGMVHSILGNPRKYYHVFIEIEREIEIGTETPKYKITRYSMPFFFDNLSVEYTLGFTKIAGICTLIYSKNDGNPAWIQFDSSQIESVFEGGVVL